MTTIRELSKAEKPRMCNACVERPARWVWRFTGGAITILCDECSKATAQSVVHRPMGREADVASP